MSLFLKIEDVLYSIYRIECINEQNNGKPSKLILYFRDKLGVVELRTDEIDNPKVFCKLYSQLYHIPAPIFNSRTWGVFVDKLFERAQVVDNTDS